MARRRVDKKIYSRRLCLKVPEIDRLLRQLAILPQKLKELTFEFACAGNDNRRKRGMNTRWSNAEVREIFDVKSAAITPAVNEPGADPEAILADLGSNGILIPAPGEVLQYLSLHPDLTAQLPAYWQVAARAGGDAAQLSLELYRDPEIDDEHLVIYIRQEDYQDNLIDRIDEAYNALLNESNYGTSGWIHVTTDFARPR
jgi:hypothetical protein